MKFSCAACSIAILRKYMSQRGFGFRQRHAVTSNAVRYGVSPCKDTCPGWHTSSVLNETVFEPDSTLGE